jgi:hypothetical protein
MNWWDFGEHTGYSGNKLSTHRIVCGFCRESGNFKTTHHVEKKDGSNYKVLNYEIFQCVNCGNYTMVFWSGSSQLHDYKTLPWPTETTNFPEHWPKDIGQYWMEAQRSLEGKNWNAAAVMARSAVQLALRYRNAVGNNLKQEIDDLAAKGLLPPVMKEWSHEVRELGNDSAHPTPASSAGTESKDANDVVQFLSTLLQMLYDLPHKIEQYRARKEP